jgi:hypothetical protein
VCRAAATAISVGQELPGRRQETATGLGQFDHVLAADEQPDAEFVL